MSDRYLIINADDFGLCMETNEAVERLFNEGRITSATVMAPGKASIDAIDRARKNSRVKMGLHITLNSDYSNDRWSSCASPAAVSSLLDEEGRLFNDLRCFYGNAREHEVSTEINAQYNHVKNAGYEPTHADSHCGTLYGLAGKPFIKEAFELCTKHGLPFRFPKSDSFICNMFGGHIPEGVRKAHTDAVMYAKLLGISLPDDIITNPFSVKDINSYHNLKSFYINVAGNIKEGITELFLHPSMENSFYMSSSPEWQKRLWEYDLLMDDDFMKTLQQEDIKLVSWADAPFDRF